MRVITRRRIDEFHRKHPAAKAPLSAWCRVISASHFGDFHMLRNAFGSGDYAKGLYVFDAGPYRLIAAIHFNRQTVFIRHVLTHDEYDRGHWRKE